MHARIGASGWQYDSWRGVLYDRALPRREWLRHYSTVFGTVEVNSTFYGLPSPATVDGWRGATDPDFAFALKMSQFLTHRKQLRDPETVVERFMGLARLLGKKLGPILLQLPPTLPVHLDRLRATVEAFPRGQRLAVEFREPSWYASDVRAYLEERDVALCLADRESRVVTPLWRTADWGYVRLHSGRAEPRPHYGRGALRSWAERIERLWPDGEDVFVYLNNDTGGWAPRDALTLRRYLARQAEAAVR